MMNHSPTQDPRRAVTRVIRRGGTGEVGGIGAGVAAAGLVGAVVVAAMWMGGGEASSPGDAAENASEGVSTSQEVADVEVHQETAVIGRGRLVVEVPRNWGRNEMHCGEATADTVVFEFSGGRGCAAAPSNFDTVTIGSAHGHRASASATETSENGVTIFTSEPSAEGDGFTVVEVLAPDQDARVLIRTQDPALAQAIADTAQALAPDQTTMPDVYLGATGGRSGYSAAPGPEEVAERLDQAGLSARFRYEGQADADQWSGLQADTRPGAVVPRGTVVAVTYSLGSKRP